MPVSPHRPDFRNPHTLMYIGMLGLLLFWLLRPSIDLYSGLDISASRGVAESRFTGILGEFGIPTDTLAWTALRYQRHGFYSYLKDSSRSRTHINPYRLNRAGVPITGWRIQAGPVFNMGAISSNPNAYLSENQPIRLDFDDRLRVRSAEFRDPVMAFLPGDSIQVIGRRLMTDILNYDATLYQLESSADSQTEIRTAEEGRKPGTLRWTRLSSAVSGPLHVDVVVEPAAIEVPSDSTLRIVQGIRVRSVTVTYHELEASVPANSGITDELFYLFGTLALLAGVVVVAGFIQIYRGQVIWFRGVVMFGLLFIGLFGWRYITFTDSYYRLFTGDMAMIDLIGQGIYYFILAVFGAVAYVTWESIARINRDPQMATIDAIWNRRVWNRQIGRSVVAGYAFGGMALALWAIGLYWMDVTYFQWDSQLGYTDVTTSLPALAVLMNSWTNTWLIGFSAFGVVLSLIQNRVRRSLPVLALSPIILGLLLVMLGRTSASSGTVAQDMLPIIAFCVPLVLATRYFGLLSTLTSWWFAYMVIRLGPYLQSSDPFLVGNGVALTLATALPLVVGYILYRFAPEETGRRFVPEYEERSLKQLRIEKEFQIAKESQFALMPKSAPVLAGAEVKGFFIPSFEVGGDYYDYQIHGADLMVTIVDVSGKAMKAAFCAIFTSGLLLSRTTSQNPAEVLTDINPLLYHRTDRQTFVTCLLARFDHQTRLLRFANAGHCRPLLKRGGELTYLDADPPRFPLGMREHVTYREAVHQLQPGDLVLFYSDGLPEARHPEGGIFDYSGLETLMSSLDTAAMSPDAICDVIRQKILDYSAYELADDMTVVVMKVV